MKMLLTIGPPGSGKSTWCKKYLELFPDWVRVSGDDQGKEGHRKLFLESVAAGKDILVDRMNFNQDQRKFYIEAGRAAGYFIEYRYFGDISYKTCLDRIMNRTGHPNLCGDLKKAREVLDMYWEKEYVYGLDKEFDEGSDYYGTDKKVLNLDSFLSDEGVKRIFVITDPHACYEDAMAMLAHMGYVAGHDILIIIGDLNDRGPDAASMIKFALYTPNVFAILGNHDIKLRKWLRGNNVQIESLKGTIQQLTDAGMISTQEQRDELYYRMMDMPYIIKADNNYFAHAGFHPFKHPEATTREFCLFARHFDPIMGSFSKKQTDSMWFTFPRKYPEYNLFFGHIVQEQMPVLEDKRIYAMDGGICFGETNRGAMIDRTTGDVKIFELKSTRPLKTKEDKWDFMNKFEPYEIRVDKGYLQKKEKGSLVLYNYNDKCTYDKAWDSYTMECRGLILDKDSGLTVARPFPKFFNLGELENKSLPQMPVGMEYTIEDKLDGSLGILYKDPADNLMKIATRGSFDSDQAHKGTEIFQKHLAKVVHVPDMLELQKIFDEYTLLFEIIYPENRMNDGARLVCDYGSTETLILLAGINKVSGKELKDSELHFASHVLDLPLRTVFDYTLDQVIAMKKDLPVTQEGFVVKFANGFRVKVKGDEYCRMQRILNGINPLAIWEQMMLSETFELSEDYKKMIPEEILPEVNDIERRIREVWAKKIIDIQQFYVKLGKDSLRDIGIYCHNPENGVDAGVASGLFMIQKKEFAKFFKYVAKSIRPTGNVIGA